MFTHVDHLDRDPNAWDDQPFSIVHYHEIVYSNRYRVQLVNHRKHPLKRHCMERAKQSSRMIVSSIQPIDIWKQFVFRKQRFAPH